MKQQKIIKRGKIYEINPEKKAVCALYEDVPNIVSESRRKCSRFTAWFINMLVTNGTINNISKLRGLAKCDNEDEFDQQIGMDIAESKLDWKSHFRLYKQYKKVYIELEKSLNEVNELMRFHAKKMGNIEKDYERVYLK